MKKNVMMRVASALLVAVLMTTCAISGTFAKYTSEVTGKDTARVAKWGWGTNTVTIDLFKDAYDGTVDSNDGADVIAPGTKNSASIVWNTSFIPEVAYEITFDSTTNTSIPAELEAKLNWTLSMDGVVTSHATFAELVTELQGKKYEFAANTANPTINVQIGWEWPFEVNPEGNESDTDLGDDIADLAELTIEVKLIATQKN